MKNYAGLANMSRKPKKQRGPKPEHLRINGDWEDAVKKAVKKKRPKDGWPDKPKKKKPK